MAETKKKQYSTAVRTYEYTTAAVPERTQGNGTPPKGDICRPQE